MDDSVEKNLKKRLYMNFSQRSTSRQQHPLHQSLTKQSSKGFSTILIPKIYTQSHRKPQAIDRSMANLRGRAAIERQQSHKKNQNHSRVIPQLAKEPMQPIEPNHLSEEGRALAKNSQKSLHKRKDRVNKELIMNLTPRNIFSFFETYPDMQLDFFYLNKFTHPYDYRIVDFNERNMNEYMTISCKGVTQLMQKQAYFMTREEWMAEENMYEKLQQIDFFRKYKVNKNFRIWKNMMKRHYMKEMSNLLNQKLFTASSSQNALLMIKQHCLDLEEECKMLSYNSHPPYSIEEFKSSIIRHQQDVFVKAVRGFENKIVEELIRSIQQSVEAYKVQNNLIDLKKENKGDEGHKEKLDYSKEALLRMHYIKITNFIRLVDAMLLDAKATMIQNNLQQLLDTLKSINYEQKDDWLLCKADWNGYILLWSPDRNKIKDTFSHIVNNALKALQDEHFILQWLPEFTKYYIEDEKCHLKKEDRATIQSICSINDEYSVKLSDISDELDVAFDRVEDEQVKVMEFANIYERHRQNQNMSIDDMTVYELRKTIGEFCEEDIKMQKMQEKVELGLILLDFTELRKHMRNSPAQSRARLLQLLPGLLQRKYNELDSKIKQFDKELREPPAKIETFVTFTKSVSKVSDCLDGLASSSRELILMFSMAEELKIPKIEGYKQKVKGASTGVARLKKKIDESNANYDQKLNKFKEQLEASVAKTETVLNTILSRYADTPLNHKESNIDQMLEFIDSIKKQMGQLNKQAEQVNYIESELSLCKTSFEKLNTFYKEFVLVQKLWVGRKEWKDMVHNIKDSQFLQVDHNQLRTKYDEAIKLACMLLKSLLTNQVTKVFYDEIVIFEMVIATLVALHDPHLRDHEWKEITKFLYRCKNPGCEDISEVDSSSMPLSNRNDPIYTINWIIIEEIYLYREQLAYFGMKSAKEEELANMLKDIKNYMNEAELSLVACSDGKEGIVLGNNDKLFLDIDDKLITLNSIMASKYVDNIRPRVEILIKQLRYLQELFDQMVLHQANWMYLEPLLSNSSYSAKSLTKEAKEFATCDSTWRRIAKTIRDNPTLKRIADDMQSNFYMRTLTKNNASFEQIKKLLEDYIERKRVFFPRFYFLSNEELLDLLSKTKTPKTLEPYLCRLFEQVREFIYDKEQPCGVINTSGDQLIFKQFSLRPQAQAEEIVKAVQEQIKKNISSLIRSTLPKYQEEYISRMTLIEEFPYQIASITDWILWTKLTEQYLDPDCQSNIQEWSDLQIQQVTELVTRLRIPKLALTKRLALSAMILQSIYMREKTEILYKKEAASPNDFNWLIAVKFYSGVSGLPEVFMKQFHARMSYGFEFQDIPTQMVMSPQTQRAWLNFNIASEQRYCPSIQGQLCSGKKETTRQLARMLAHNYIEFQCNKYTSLRVIERMLAGLVLTGSWIAFKNLESIRAETLSVMAGHFFNIRKALIENKDSLYFTKGNISLNPNLNIILHSNTRQKSASSCLGGFLRPVAVIIPPMELMVRSLLECSGFFELELLTSHFTKLLDYCSTAFAHHSSMNFGIPTARLMIQQMLIYRDQNNQAKEEWLFVKATQHVVNHDLDSIQSELVSGFVSLLTGPTSPVSTSQLDTPKSGTQCGRVRKANELIEMLRIKSGVMIVGQSLQGKTSITKAAAVMQNIQLHFITHGCHTQAQLLGDFDTNQTGLISLLLKNSTLPNWIVFDGPVDRSLLSICELLQQTPSFCQSSGERLKCPNVKVIFETDSIEHAAPGLISRVGKICIDNVATIDSLIKYHLSESLRDLTTDDFVRGLTSHLTSALKKILTPKRQYSCVVNISDLTVTTACCNNISQLFKQHDIILKEKESKDFKKIIDRLTIWAVVWGLGSFISQESSARFETIVCDVFKMDNLPSGNVFSYSLSSAFEWVPWQNYLPNQLLDSSTSLHDIMIWSSETYAYGYFTRSHILSKSALMIIGESGTGKSKLLRRIVSDINREENSLSRLWLTLSKGTSPANIQNLIEERLQSQRRNGHTIVMPPPGKKLLVHIDDLNLNSASAPAMELLRQHLSHSGIYDRKSSIWKTVEDVAVSIIARQPTTQTVQCGRFINRFNMLFMKPNQETLTTIFCGVFKAWLKHSTLNEDITKILLSGKLIDATIALSELCKKQLASKTPEKYRHLLRYSSKDIFRVLQSLTRIGGDVYTKSDQVARVWANECIRTFADRLPDKAIKQPLYNTLKKQILMMFKYDMSENFFRQSMLYCSSIGSGNYTYLDYDSTCLTLREKMIELSPKFSLLLFKELVEHIIHIIRVLSMQQGHFMLIGPRASGKKSIVQLACFVAKVDFQIETKNKLGNMQNAFLKAAEGIPTCFYVNQNCLYNEEQLHQLVCILNQTICPFDIPKELSQKINRLFSETRSEPVMDIFFETVYKNLHVVIGTSPSEDFKRITIENPALISCCSVDFMNNWPDQALYQVAQINMPEEIFMNHEKIKMAKIASLFHRVVEDAIESHKLPIVLSPRRYLELISLFSYKYQVRKEEINYIVAKIQKCMEKYGEITVTYEADKASVHILEEIFKVITSNQEQVLQELENQKSMLLQITTQSPESQTTEEETRIKKDLIGINDVKKTLTQNFRFLCQKLNSTSKQELNNLRKGLCVRNDLLPITQSIALLLGQQEPLENNGKGAIDTSIMVRLKIIQLSSVGSEVISNIENKLRDFNVAEYTEEPIKTIVCWIQNICQLAKQYSEVCSKQTNVSKQPSQKTTSDTILLAHKVSTIQTNLSSIRYTKSLLETQIKQGKERINLGKEIKDKLDEEQKQWTARLNHQNMKLKTLIYDLFFACSAFSYLGPFSHPHRKEIIDMWRKILQNEKVSFGQLEFGETLFDTFEIDSLRALTEENLLSCLIMIKSPSIPYLIDPDRVATEYLASIYPQIKHMIYGEQGFMAALESYVKDGSIVFIEYSEPTISASLQPLLTKNQMTLGSVKMVKLSDTPIECHESFKMFLCNKWCNVQPSSDIYDNCSVINFDITQNSVQQHIYDCLLETISPHDRHIIEEETSRVSDISISLKAKNEKILSLIENMDMFLNSQQDNLEELRKLETKKQQLELELLQQKKKVNDLNDNHKGLKDLAVYLSELEWFCLNALLPLNDKYNYSMGEFRHSLKTAIIETVEKTQTQYKLAASERDQLIITRLGQLIHNRFSRVIRNANQNMFRLMFMIRIETLKYRNVQFSSLFKKITEVPDYSKLQTTQLLTKLRQNGYFNELVDKFQADTDEFENWLSTVDFTHPKVLYGPFQLSPLQRLMLVRLLKPYEFLDSVDRITKGYFVYETGPTLVEILNQANNRTPVCLIIENVDPLIELMSISRERKHPKDAIALYQINSENEPTIEKALETSTWLVLHNVKQPQMKFVEKLIEQLRRIDSLKEDFRFIIIFTRDEQWNALIQSINDTCVKLLMESVPKRMFENVVSHYKKGIDSGEHNNFNELQTAVIDFYRRLLICGKGIQQRHVFAMTNTLEILSAMSDHPNAKDLQQTMSALLACGQGLQQANLQYQLSQCFAQHMISDSDMLPDREQQECVRQTKIQNQIAEFLQPKQQRNNQINGTFHSQITQQNVEALLDQIKGLHISVIRQSNDPILNYLIGECQRYKSLITMMREDLERLVMYLNESVCDNCSQVEQILSSLRNNLVPQRWHENYVLSKTCLGDWLEELKRNCETLKRWWLKEERPKYLNINMLYYPASFLKTTLIKYAKKMKLKVDKVMFSYKVFNGTEVEPISSEFIINISDICLRDCRYDVIKGCIEECHPGEHVTKLGVMQLTACEPQKPPVNQSQPLMVNIPIFRNQQTQRPEDMICQIELATKKKSEYWTTNNVWGFCEKE